MLRQKETQKRTNKIWILKKKVCFQHPKKRVQKRRHHRKFPKAMVFDKKLINNNNVHRICRHKCLENWHMDATFNIKKSCVKVKFFYKKYLTFLLCKKGHLEKISFENENEVLLQKFSSFSSLYEWHLKKISFENREQI